MSYWTGGLADDRGPGRVFLLLKKEGLDGADTDRMESAFESLGRLPRWYQKDAANFSGLRLVYAAPRCDPFEVSLCDGSLALLDSVKLPDFCPTPLPNRPGGALLNLLLSAASGRNGSLLSQLPGGWSFVHHDPHDGAMVAGRDLFGSRPLYFRVDGTALWMSNALQLLLSERPYPDLRALRSYATLSPPQYFGSPYVGVSRCPPGFLMRVSRNGALRFGSWWRPPEASIESREEHVVVDRFRESILSAVADLIGSNGVACTLSGGLDSAIVTAAATSRSAKIDARPTTAISMRFPGDSRADEGAHIQAIVEHVGVRCDEIRIHEAITISELEAFYRHQWVPQFINAGWYTRIAAAARERGHDVVLTGVGGDHISNGHELAISDLLLRGQAGLALRLFFDCWVRGSMTALGLLRSCKPPGLRSFLARPRLAALSRESERRLLLRRLSGLRCLPVLEGLERIGAPYDVSFIHPLLDPRLVQFVLSLSPGRLFSSGDERGLYRKVAAGFLPAAISEKDGKADFAGLARDLYDGWLFSSHAREVQRFGLISSSELRGLQLASPQGQLDGLLGHLIPLSVFLMARF